MICKIFDRFWSYFPYNITDNIANAVSLLVIQLPFNLIQIVLGRNVARNSYAADNDKTRRILKLFGREAQFDILLIH